MKCSNTKRPEISIHQVPIVRVLSYTHVYYNMCLLARAWFRFFPLVRHVCALLSRAM